MAKRKKFITKTSEKFLFKYLNNTSPTGYEAEGQKIWLDYIKPYTDEHFVDIYGTAVAVINPKAKYKVVIEAHADEISGRYTTLPKMDLFTFAETVVLTI